MASSPERKLFISIDFGTYGVFVAFSAPRNVANAQAIKEWKGFEGLQYEKNLNTILLRKSDLNEVVAYGFEAQSIFIEAKQDDEAADYAYFENFKPQLLQNESAEFDPNKQVEPVDHDENATRGLCQLVAQCLKEIKTHSLTYYRERVDDSIKDEEILWILSVPAKWTPTSRKAMKSCCVHIGIDENNVLIVTEPEAAGSYFVWGTEEGQKLVDGDKYLVLDCGSGTYDAVAHELFDGRQLREIHYADGDLKGAADVDKEFVKLLKAIVGEESFDAFEREYPTDFVDQMKYFQSARERATMSEPSRKVPIVEMLLDVADERKVDYKENIRNYRVEGDPEERLKYKNRPRHMLEIGQSLWRKLHEDVVEEIVEFTEELLHITGVPRLFLVGGFSQSDFIRTRIGQLLVDEFDEKVELLMPPHPETAVTMGSLWAAHKKVVSHKLNVSFGIAVDREYCLRDPDDHKVADASSRSGYITRDCFSVLWPKGADYTVGQKQDREFVLLPGQRDVEIVVYKSTEEVTYFVDEGDWCVPGMKFSYRIPMNFVSPSAQTLVTSFEFGEDCLVCNIHVRDESGGEGKVRKLLEHFPDGWMDLH